MFNKWVKYLTKKIEVCKLEDLSKNNVFATQVNGKKIMLRKFGDKVLATSATCTHKEVDLTKRGVFDEEYVTCTNHLATFDMTTGEVVQPPATQPLEVFDVRIKNEKIFVTLNGDV